MSQPRLSTGSQPAQGHALTPSAAGEYLGNIATKTLANWRSLGIGPAYVRYSGGKVAYLIEDLEAFRRSRRVTTGGTK